LQGDRLGLHHALAGSVAAFRTRLERVEAADGETASDGAVKQGSYRDLELMLAYLGVAVDNTTIFSWIQAYARSWRRSDIICTCGVQAAETPC
jgi:hypothetical protein